MSSTQVHTDVHALPLHTPSDARAFAARRDTRNPWSAPPGITVAPGTALGRCLQVDAVNRLLNDCGCQSGQRWLAAVLSTLLLLTSPAPGAVPGDGASQVLVWAVALLGGAVIGKTRGVRRSRRQAIDLLLRAADAAEAGPRAASATGGL